ncbi:MAG: hypothetical protein KC493_07115 [Bacteriovoracaceae bacterium]|nr:hypothetical protein [Bacteriovoracaceae bacterium]
MSQFKKMLISFVWIFSMICAFLYGKKSVEPVVKVEVKDKIIYKKVIEKSKQPQEKMRDKKEVKKEKKEVTNDKKYYQKRYDFLTKSDVREEAEIDCKNGEDSKCWQLKEYYRLTGNRKKLLQYLINNCSGDKVDSCVSLFNFDENKARRKKIKSNLGKSCDEDNAEACVSLGNLIEFSDSKIDKVAFEFRKKGCELDVKTCSSLAHTLKRANDLRAGEFFLKACEAGGKYSCMSASQHFFEIGDKDKAGEMIRIGCDREQKYNCRRYYDFLLANNRVDQAKIFKEQSCDSEMTKKYFNCD